LRVGGVAATLHEALRLAVSEPPGPVHLDLPEDVCVAPASESPLPSPEGSRLPAAADADIARLGQRLHAARRPVAVIGASTRRMRHPDLLRAFVERHQMPFASTTMAKGMIDEDHPLSIGCLERARRQVQRRFLRSADLVVGLGYDVVEVEYEQWIGDVPLASVDIERVDAAAAVNVVHEITGDLDESLARMIQFEPGSYAWPAEVAVSQKQEFQKLLRPPTSRFAPHQAIDVARHVLPKDGILTFDVGAHTHQIASQWTAHAPHQFLITNGWSSMGFGIPAAIAAKLARPELPVLCLIGDGCFQMTCGEVAVAKRLGLTLPIVVLDDGWLALIEVKQVKRGLAVYGTDVRHGPREDTPAHYFGVPAVGVRGADELERELTKAFAANGPTVIEAVVDPAHYKETVYD
jgi:acetolactate synthase-1/2/3 large subunit